MVYDDKVRYTMRIDRKLLDKFGYIAEYEGRTKNREIEQMMKRRIADLITPKKTRPKRPRLF